MSHGADVREASVLASSQSHLYYFPFQALIPPRPLAAAKRASKSLPVKRAFKRKRFRLVSFHRGIAVRYLLERGYASMVVAKHSVTVT